MIETLNKVMQIQKQLLQELGHEPTPDEVAIEMGFAFGQGSGNHENGSTTDFLQSPVGDSDDTNFRRFH